MSYQYHISVDDLRQIIVVNSAGMITVTDAGLMYTEVANLLRQKGFYRVLLDSRQVTLNAVPFSIMQFIESFTQQKMFEGVKIARLVGLHSFSHEFVEQVAEHNQIEIKNFEKVSEALVWLTATQDK